MPSPIRVMSVDDHRLVRDGISLIVAREPDMVVVASASTAEEAIALYDVHRPDVTLMDLQLGAMSGVEAILAIRQLNPQAGVIVVTMFHGDDDVYRAMQAGASAYLVKDTLSDELVRVIREVHTGSHLLDSGLTERLKTRPAIKLTTRETQVLELIAEGLRNRHIATRLAISEETVRMHVKNVLMKLEADHRTAAVAIAMRRGLIRPPQR